MTIETIDNCQVEWDKERGVLYVHSSQGITIIRICGMPKSSMVLSTGSIDITAPERLAYTTLYDH